MQHAEPEATARAAPGPRRTATPAASPPANAGRGAKPTYHTDPAGEATQTLDCV